MILRLTAKAKCVVHVPKLLYYWRSHAGSVASDINAKSYAIEAAKGAVAASLRQQGFENLFALRVLYTQIIDPGIIKITLICDNSDVGVLLYLLIILMYLIAV